jgi:hypothetical protein
MPAPARSHAKNGIPVPDSTGYEYNNSGLADEEEKVEL